MKENKLLRTSAIFAGIVGFLVLISVIYPIASYESLSRKNYPNLISPIEGRKTLGEKNLAIDYTKASNWFVGGAKTNEFSNKVAYYTISIPKLGIDKATVVIGSEDLSKNLIHYPGTAVPGKIGNAVVFGHSVLPQFFDPENYISIFSTLPTLENGDLIRINYDGVSYTYQVEKKFEVLPTEIQVLDQPTDDSYISLITCVPPGHPLKPKRLVVTAKIVANF